MTPLSERAILRHGSIFASNVYRMLHESNVTVDYLAQYSGVSKSTIYRIIGKKKTKRPYRPTLPVIARFAHAAKVKKVDDFINHHVQYVD